MSKRALAALLALVMVVCLLPCAAFAEGEDTFDLAITQCTEIGEYMEGPVYYYSGEIPTDAANIRFVDFDPDDVSFISGLLYDMVYEPTNIAPLRGGFIVPDEFAESDSWVPKAAYSDFDFTGKYFYCISYETEEDDCKASFVVNIPTEETTEIPFTATADGDVLVVSLSDEKYECYGVPADLFIVAVPLRYIEKVTLDFGENEYIATYYDAEGTYGGAYTPEWDKGEKSIDVPDFDYFVWIQNPYASDWMSGGDTVFVVCFKPIFEAYVSGTDTQLTEVEYEKNGYNYNSYDFQSDSYTMVEGDLYTITVPFGVTDIDFVFSDNCLAYNYNVTGSHPAVAKTALAGFLDTDELTVGYSEYTRSIDSDADGVIDYIQVQNPYNSDWSGAELLYAITFKYIFGAYVDGEAMTDIEVAEGTYPTFAYDENYNPIPGDPVTLYTVALPDGTETVDLVFPEAVLAYNYTSDAKTWIAGDFDATVGVTELTVSVDANSDGEPDCIQVQNLYNEDWTGGEVIYAITFDVGGLTPGGEGADVTAEELRDNIAAKLAETGISDDGNAAWFAADMMAYAGLFPDSESKLSDQQKQDMADKAIAEIAAATTPNAAARNIIALAAMGFDPRQLTAADGEALDAVAKLDELTFGEEGALTSGASNVYAMPYILIAYQQFNDCEEQCLALVNAAIEAKAGWLDATWGVDGLTPMLLALAPYSQEENVKAALDEALAALAAAQVEDGSIADYTGAGNAASTGLAMAGLAALGTDPAEFVNGTSGKSLKDGIVIFAGEDGASLVPISSTFSTEQGFRGLVALAGAQNGAYRIFDFSGNIDQRVPAAATSAKAGADFSVAPSDATVTVKDAEGNIVEPSAQGGKSYDLDAGTYTYTVEKEGYVTASGVIVITEADVEAAERHAVSISLTPDESGTELVTITVKVLVHDPDTCGNALTYKNDPDKYYSIFGNESYQITMNSATANAADALVAALIENNIEYELRSNGYFASIGGYTEAEHGQNSGWLYMVDGATPSVTADQYFFTKDSTLIFFYTDDYSKDYGSEAWNTEPSGDDKDNDTFFDDVEETDWFYDAVKYAADNGLMNGIGDNKFDPAGTTTRGMVVTILYRLEGEPEVSAESIFSDVSTEDPEWYTDAVLWASENGIIQGYAEGGNMVFGTDDPITREQFATILYRYEQYKGGGFVGDWYFLLEYEDADQISDWADEAMHWCVMKGIIKGCTETTLVPKGKASRAEAATMLMRFIESAKG
ncbi:MAG: S-layer homology domain-containing protein [Oscillospiraceae bacterium]|nr:S-layer homology domain-containing protein [Oscillospiraceae bacterium]